jgi:hypothetical protein
MKEHAPAILKRLAQYEEMPEEDQIGHPGISCLTGLRDGCKRWKETHIFCNSDPIHIINIRFIVLYIENELLKTVGPPMPPLGALASLDPSLVPEIFKEKGKLHRDAITVWDISGTVFEEDAENISFVGIIDMRFVMFYLLPCFYECSPKSNLLSYAQCRKNEEEGALTEKTYAKQGYTRAAVEELFGKGRYITTRWTGRGNQGLSHVALIQHYQLDKCHCLGFALSHGKSMRTNWTGRVNFASGCNRLELGESSRWGKKSGWKEVPVLSRHLPEPWKVWVYDFLCEQLGLSGWTMDGRRDSDT